MAGIRRILLYGNSVILGSIGAGLRHYPLLEVASCEPSPADFRLLSKLRPDVLLFDSEATDAEEVLPLLESHPAMLLIGVSPDINVVKVWSGRQLREMSLQDLTEVITRERRILSDLGTERSN